VSWNSCHVVIIIRWRAATAAFEGFEH